MSSQRKDKVLTILDPKRSNQINIALTNLPPVSSLRDIILDMKDDITRDDIEKLQALLPTEEEVTSIRFDVFIFNSPSDSPLTGGEATKPAPTSPWVRLSSSSSLSPPSPASTAGSSSGCSNLISRQ